MRLAATFLALLLIGTLPAAALVHPVDGPTPAPTVDTGSEAGPGTAGATAPQRTGALPPPLVTEIRLTPDPSGDVRWQITIRYAPSSPAERAAFRQFGRAFERGDTDVSLDLDFFRTLATEAGRTTDREMSITRPSRNATLGNGTATLRLSFTWTNFVTTAGDRFVIRQAVLMPNGRTWLSSIDSSQRLVIETPPGYRVSDTRFGLENGSVVIEGPHTFEEPLTVAYRRSSTGGDDGPPWSLVGVAVLGVGVLVVAYVRRRGRDRGAGDDAEPSGTARGGADPDAATTDDESESGEGRDVDEPGTEGIESDATGDATGDATDEADGAAGPAGADSGDDADTDSASTEADSGDGADVDPALLSDEERVERLLDRNGGRMKQAQIVEETGWSDAKVSQLLSSMADEERVEKLRLGRENLISLPDEDS